MNINRIIGAVRTTLGIKTKVDKNVQKQIQQDLQLAADKLEGKVDLFTRRNNGSIDHLKVSAKEIVEMNEGHARILQKAGIPDINNNPNYDRHNLEKFDDFWNPYSKG